MLYSMIRNYLNSSLDGFHFEASMKSMTVEELEDHLLEEMRDELENSSPEKLKLQLEIVEEVKTMIEEHMED